MKPMLAATLEDVRHIKFPILASPKLDGIRALVYKGALVSRNLKPIPNKHIQKLPIWKHLEGVDGELIVGDPCAKDCFRKTSSGVMSANGEPDYKFFAFDRVDSMPYERRIKDLSVLMEYHAKVYPRFGALTNAVIKDVAMLYKYEQRQLDLGFEGIMLRSFDGAYKFGRSTLREGGLMKLKRFADSEAEILKVIELEHNENEKTKDELGRAKRSSLKAGKVGGKTMGALNVRDIHSGVIFDIGTGFTDKERAVYWVKRRAVIGEVVKYKYFPSGSKDKPRFPVWLGKRHENDR